MKRPARRPSELHREDESGPDPRLIPFESENPTSDAAHPNIISKGGPSGVPDESRVDASGAALTSLLLSDALKSAASKPGGPHLADIKVEYVNPPEGAHSELTSEPPARVYDEVQAPPGASGDLTVVSSAPVRTDALSQPVFAPPPDPEPVPTFEDERRSDRRTAAALIITAAAIFLLLAFGLYRINVIKLPGFISGLFDPPATSQPGGEVSGGLYGLLENEAADLPERTAVGFDVTSDDYRRMLADAPYIDEYTVNMQLTLSEGGKRVTKLCYIWRSGDCWRVELQSPTVTTTSVCDGEKIAITDYTAGALPVTRIFPISDEFSLESMAGIPSLDSFLPTAFPTGQDALTPSGREGINDLSITLVRSEADNYYMVSYSCAGLPQTESLTVSVRYGLVLRAETVYSGAVVYSAATTLLTPTITGYTGDPGSIFYIG